MRSRAPCCGCSSPAGICSNGFRQPRQRSDLASISSASTASWRGGCRARRSLLARSSLGCAGMATLAAGGCRSLVALDRIAGDRALDRAGLAAIAWPRSSASVSADDAHALRLIARRTWRFFETFVTAAENMLPPDNFQEDPAPALAHRTSPTNLGLYLLSIATARDFAWIGTTEAAERLEATLTTMGAPCSDSAAISTTGTTRAICARSIRLMSPPSTAGTSPAI